MRLPPEVWLGIAEFIPPNIFQNLYSLNSVFLDLVLNHKYHDINLATSWSPSTVKHLKHLKLPHIAHRVRRLTLSADWVERSMSIPSPQLPIWTLVAYLPFDLARFIVRQTPKLKKCKKLMENMAFDFPNLSSLDIFERTIVPTSVAQPTLLVNAYAACASKLRTLSIDATSENFNLLLPLNVSELTSLEKVTFTFSRWGPVSIDMDVVSSFFEAIASKLTTLNIIFNYSSSEEPMRLLHRHGGIVVFPNLTSFSLFHWAVAPPYATSGPALVGFLNRHARTLKHVRLQHPNLGYGFDQILPYLPHLETLLIQKISSTSRWDQELTSSESMHVARAYVQHSGITLTSLCLRLCSFTLHDLSILMDLLVRGSSDNMEGKGLKSLTVAVKVMSPQVLDMLAEKLPHLEELTVAFGDLSGDVPILTAGYRRLRQNEESFIGGMKKRSYPDWSLRSFGMVHMKLTPDVMMSIATALSLCIPHLVEIHDPFMWKLQEGTWR